MNITDKTPLLTPAQKSLLEKSARVPFMLGGFVSFDDILSKLKVYVFIEPGIPTRSEDGYYDKAIEYWKKALEQLRERMREDESLEEMYRKLLERIERLYSEKRAYSSMMLLGQYDSRKNIIILYPEAMVAADASKTDEYLVSTFAHEVMHAYFNRSEHENYPYAMFVEEPLAEFGMLLYMHETHSPYYDWAHDNVSGKNSCYHYGANLMDQYLDGDYFFRKCLEEYKVSISEYEMLDISNNGRVSMPEDGGFVIVNGQPIAVRWTPANSVPPTFFWDDATKTLGLDGDWRGFSRLDLDSLLSRTLKNPHYYHHYLHENVQNVYLGKDFVGYNPFHTCPVFVSPQNKEFASVKGIIVQKIDNTPMLHRLGEGLYELKRNGQYAIIDSNLDPITPFQYDSIERFDKNGLCEVRIDGKYGLVNKQGKEQVPVIYDNITEKGRFYEVKLNGEVFIIDKLGNKQSEKEK